MPNNNNNNVELRSEEVQEIISYVPHWLIRSGTTIFFLIMILIIAISWLIHYPDIVKASFRLTSINAPRSVTCRADGKLVRLFAKENTLVKKGAVLAFLESAANHEEILSLAAHLESIEGLIQNEAPNKLIPSSFNHLGELQTAYQAFDLSYTEFLSFQTKGFYLIKRDLLKKELQDLSDMEVNLQEQKNIYQKDWELASDELAVQKNLAEQNVIAPLEFKREQSRLLSRQLPLKQAESSLLNNRTAQKTKLKEILELNKLIGEQRNNILQALRTLRSSIDSWKIKYVLTAPVEGKVFFASIIEENQTLFANQELFFIAPETTAHFGEIFIPQHNLGKVELDQEVLIKFNGYPFQEYGLVKGKISFISQMPLQDSAFLAKVDLPNGLTTNYGKKLIYKTGMKATAEVVTKDTRLIEKLFYNFRRTLAR